MHHYGRIAKSIHHTAKKSNNAFSNSNSHIDEKWSNEIRNGLESLFAKITFETLKSLNVNLNCFRHCLILLHKTFQLWIDSEIKYNPFILSITASMIAFKITDKRKSINEIIQSFYNSYTVHLSEKRLLRFVRNSKYFF